MLEKNFKLVLSSSASNPRVYIANKYNKKKLQISIIEENYILSQSLDFNHMIGRNANIHVLKLMKKL